MDIMIYGKSEQFTTTGKNVLKVSDGTLKTRGITVTAKDGIIALKGTATENGWATLNIDSFVLDGTYILSSNISTVLNVFAVNKSFKSVLEQNKSVVLENAEISRVCFTVKEGKTYDISNILVQIEQGSEATSYEPYTGGKPSPTPDYPQEIKSVVNPVIKVRGKNLFDFSRLVSDGVNMMNYEKQTITIPAKTNNTGYNQTLRDMCPGITPGTYVFSMKRSNPKSVTGSYFLEAMKDFPADTPIELTDELLDNQIAWYNNQDSEVENVISEIQVERGNAVTSYEPYHEQTVTLPYTLNAISVSSGGNVTIDGQQYIADRILEKDGVFGIERYIVDISEYLSSDSMDFDGTSEKTNKIVYHVNHKLKNNIYPCASDILPWKIVWNVDEEGVYVDSSSVIIRINKTRCGTEEQVAKEWMDATMSKHHLYTCLSDVVFQLLDQDLQAYLKDLHTNYPVTNISITSDQLDGYAVFNYPVSMANGWNYVKQQLNDNRDYIYDMDLQSAEAYVNSEYAVALTELEV